MHCEILIIGAGPTGLGAATRLHEHGKSNWLLIDENSAPGGLASTDVTREGFLFDLGGHVIFSHYQYFDDLLSHAVGKNWNVLERVSFCWIKNQWVPYPLQSNLYCLPLEDKIACVRGLLTAKPRKCDTFDEWILSTMGEGLADLFMRPYNFKVWAYPTNDMQCAWLGERVATVDLPQVMENILRNKPSYGWGPNATFKFPKKGGTGGIWKKVCDLLPRRNLEFSKRLIALDVEKKEAHFSDGSIVKYEKLLLTIPLDLTLKMTRKDEIANRLNFSSTHVIGIGVRGVHNLGDKCWMYFSEDTTPFYRCTVFSNYAEENCPAESTLLPTLRKGGDEEFDASMKPGPYWSLMFEVSESMHKPVDENTIVEETIAGAVRVGLFSEGSEIVSVYHRRLHRGYPTPHLNRDAALSEAEGFLRSHDIWSRGRFGAWKYEVSNQDHSLMQGVEAIDNILFATEEMTLNHPDVTNKSRNTSLTYSK